MTELAISAYRIDLAKRGMPPKQIELAVKSLPSSPIWTQAIMDWGFWDTYRNKLWNLTAAYQKNDVVHGAISKIANTIVNAGLSLVEVSDEPDKATKKSGRRKLTTKRLNRITGQWNIAQLKRKSLNDGETLVEVTEHPMIDALNSDAEDQSRDGLLRLIAIGLGVWGVTPLMKNRNGDGDQPSSYRYLPAYNVVPNRQPSGRIKGWWYSPYGEALTKKNPLDKDDVILFRFPSVTDPHAGGDSPLLAALNKVDLAGKLLDHENWTLSNRARMDGVFVPKIPDSGTISKEEAERQEKRINDKLRGAGNGRWVVSEFGGQYIPMTWSPTELAGMNIHEQLSTAILFALGVPEAFSNNEGNRANFEASLEEYARFCIAPMVSLIEGVLNAELRNEFGEENMLWVFENVVPEDEEFALEEKKVEDAEWDSALKNKACTADEFRENVLDLEPLTDQQKTELAPEPVDDPNAPDTATETKTPSESMPATNGKSFDLLKLNSLVIKGDVDRATAIKIAAYELEIPETDARELVSKARSSNKPKKLMPLPLPTGSDLANAVKIQTQIQKHHYLNQCADIATSFGGLPIPSELGKEIQKNWDDNFPELATKDDKRGEQPPGKNFVRQADWDAQDQMAYKPYLQLEAERAANGKIKQLVRVGAEEDSFSVVQPNIDAAIEKSTLKFAQSTNETTEKDLNDALEQLRGELSEGVTEGEALLLIRKRVEDVFENIGKERAAMIAQTETSRTVHEAQRITAKASGIVKGFEFIVSPDACDICLDLEGKVVGMDEQFSPNDYDNSVLPVHPNCRCTMAEVLDLDELENEDEDQS